MHAIGPREGLFLLLTKYYAGSRGSLVWQSAMPLIGQCEPIIQMLHACSEPTRGLAQELLQAAVGPTRAS